MRLFRPPAISRLIYRGAVFRIDRDKKVLCLTFDDGPYPGSTRRLLDTLGKCNIKAMFFCSGAQAEKLPMLVEEIRSSGHLLGNHGYLHLNGLRESVRSYADNVNAAAPFTSSIFFRPPYGLITLPQYRSLALRYRIFFWDVMAYDFDRRLKPAASLLKIKKKIRRGSIIALHDTPGSTVHSFLEDLVKHCRSEGFTFILPEI